MALRQLFSPADIVTVAANSGSVLSEDLSAEGAQGYFFVNTTTLQMLILDEFGALVDVLPGSTSVRNSLRQFTRYLRVAFDPSKSGQTGAQVATTAWNVWGEAYAEPQKRTIEGNV
jgi:hypothetical protein